MDGYSEWRKSLASLLASFDRIWHLKSRVALGATIASITALAILPATTAEAALASSNVVQVSPRKQGKLSSKFMLRRADGRSGKAFAEHSSHSSHKSHTSHSSGAWLR
jgi:hypothetical protein